MYFNLCKLFMYFNFLNSTIFRNTNLLQFLAIQFNFFKFWIGFGFQVIKTTIKTTSCKNLVIFRCVL